MERRQANGGSALCRARLAVALCLITVASAALAGATTEVRGSLIWVNEAYTRLVFDVGARVQYSVFALSDPDRVVIDISDARLTKPFPRQELADSALVRVRSAPREGHALRIVLDLNRPVRPEVTTREPSGGRGHQLVVDLKEQPKHPPQSVKVAARPTEAAAPPLRVARHAVVVIDPGHGGKDPGAIGQSGTREKDVALSIARKLATLVNKESGMRAVLTRDRDVYLALRSRIRKARQYQADLFVSIHADAYPHDRARGSSVFVLSERGASSEAARWLAERENQADLIGGVSLDDKDQVLASVLLDLSQSATIEASLEAANSLLQSLDGVGALHKSRVQHAGFVVLKSPDIPSVLVETAFLSNPREEKRLRDARYQQKIASALMGGIRAYFVRHPPDDTVLASRRHVIARGDTLSSIAKHYNVSVDTLRLANDLNGDMLRVGQVLHIPSRSDG